MRFFHYLCSLNITEILITSGLVAEILALLLGLAPGLIGGLVPTLVALVPIPGLTDLASIISL